MASNVYFWNLRTNLNQPFHKRMAKLLELAGLRGIVQENDLTALKLHFGERGTTGFLRPLWLKPVIDAVLAIGGKPFLTDASTLYVGQRGEAVSHAMQAARHGFDAMTLGAPVIIADGLKGGYQEEVAVKGKHLKSAFIAGAITEANSFISVNHFKGHELAGYGGALKNIGMGCASKQGKMQQHMTTGPTVHQDKCVGCGSCVRICAAKALSLDEGARVVLNEELCVGCGGCFLACKNGGLEINWKTDVAHFLEKMMEYAAAVLVPKAGRCLHLNFVMDVVPDCDCVGFTDLPICPDLGILASSDPVACDQAAMDLVNAAPPLYAGKLPKGYEPGQNKFRALHPHVPEDFGLGYAESLGLGSREYELKKI
ncbi:MAG: DUF362 domain-containing protein [Proteobacteria bacterium]|nr:DUF362 domain-containing protein [Pseudomonadota bacterium]MBU1612645.1 DUF362 domain-containing protein [Pseudomonadota bacterium]